jgi:hypothetical protein
VISAICVFPRNIGLEAKMDHKASAIVLFFQPSANNSQARGAYGVIKTVSLPIGTAVNAISQPVHGLLRV